jgi:hypothetical protein
LATAVVFGTTMGIAAQLPSHYTTAFMSGNSFLPLSLSSFELFVCSLHWRSFKYA